MQIIINWTDNENYDEEEEIIEKLQNVFYLYSEIDKKGFNEYLLGALKCFVNEIQIQYYDKIGKLIDYQFI